MQTRDEIFLALTDALVELFELESEQVTLEIGRASCRERV